MSAWLVSKNHIDVLVGARKLVPGRVKSFSGVSDDELGRKLWRENMLSLHARYGDKVDERKVASYRYAQVAHLSVGGYLKALDCYDYQSCEHGGWVTSEAKRYVTELETALAGSKAEQIRKSQDYENAPWGF
jgi:hypothetical protein